MESRGKTRRPALAAALLLLLLVSSCSRAGRDSERVPDRDGPPTSHRDSATDTEPDKGPTPESRGPSVLVISLDGLSPAAVRDLGPEGTPNLHRLLDEGAGTLNARTAYERTVTLPNHTSMLTGRPIDPVVAGHGVSFNDDHPGTIHEVRGEYVASIFDVVHDSGGSTAFYTTKSKFDFLDRSWSDAGAEDTTGADDGTDKIDVYVRSSADEVITRAADQVRADPATFAFLHVGTLDDVGHRRGWGTRRYLKAVERVDRDLGQIMLSIEQRPDDLGDTTLLVTSDHGGTGPGHLDASDPANYVVPLVLWGPGVPAGADLYSLSDAYADPGDTRPTYEGPQPLRNAHVANLTAGILDLPDVPGSSMAAAPDLVAALSDDRNGGG